MFWTLITIFSVLVGIIFAIAGFLIHKWFFKPRNNPNKARIYVDGIDRPFEGILDYFIAQGQAYKFGKDEKIIVVPNDYPYDYHYYKRTIYLDSLYHLCPYNKFTGYSISTDEKTKLLQDLWHSQIGSQAISKIKSMKKSKISFGMIVVIIVIIAVAAMAGYFLHNPAPTQAIQQQQQQSSQNSTQSQNTPYIDKGGGK